MHHSMRISMPTDISKNEKNPWKMMQLSDILNSFMLGLSFIVKLIRSYTLLNIYAKKVFEMNLSYFLYRKVMCKEVNITVVH